MARRSPLAVIRAIDSKCAPILARPVKRHFSTASGTEVSSVESIRSNVDAVLKTLNDADITSKEKEAAGQRWWALCDDAASKAANVSYITLLEVLDGLIKIQSNGERVDPLHVDTLMSGVCSKLSACSVEEAVFVLKAARHLKYNGKTAHFDLLCQRLRNEILTMPTKALVETFDHLSALSVLGLQNKRILLVMLEVLSSRLDSPSEAPSSYDMIVVFKAFSKAGVTSEFLRGLYAHVLDNLGTDRYPLSPKLATHLLYTMLASKLYTQACVDKLLAVSAREHLGTRDDASYELRSLKFIEMSLRLDYAQTYANLSKDALAYLGLVRDIRYFDPTNRHQTITSYQVKQMLKKHSFPCMPNVVGPYGLKICDRDQRIAFECLEKYHYYPGTNQLRFATETKLRHLDALGWRVFTISYKQWQQLPTYDAKTAYIRETLKAAGLLDGISPKAPRSISTSAPVLKKAVA